MRILTTNSGMRCCISGTLTLLAFFLFGTNNLVAQDDYRLPSDAVVKLYALDFDSNTSVGVPTGFVAGQERASTINVNYTGFTAPAQAAFQYAVDIWASLITSPVTIEVDAQFVPLGPTTLGSAGASTIHRNFGGAPSTNTWYPQALANSLAGTDLDPGQADINANFSSTFTWYYGTDANPPAGQYDFVSVVLHELCHGLGFFGSANVSGGLGFIQQAGDPYIYDLFVQNGGGTSILTFVDGTAALAGELQSNNLFWNGASAVAANGGNAPLYAPASWDGGSSYSHLNEASYPAGNPHSLMTPQIGAAEAIHSPGTVTLGLFEDMGWQLDSGCTLLGCTDPTACNYNAAADCDDGSCVGGSWYIPTDVAAGFTPMVLVCNGDPAPAGYFFANQVCAQASFDTDPYCVNTDWDSVCRDEYNFCQSGNVDCGNGQWYIPSPINGNPMEWDCSAPAGYILADQACAQEIVNNDSYCVNTAWDSLCQNTYDACLAGGCVELGCTDPTACNFSATADCDDGSCTFPQYYIPVDFSTSASEPMVQVCAGSEPANYILANQVCAQERVDFDSFCINVDWDQACVIVYNCCAGNPPGCSDEFACNFDPNACTDFALCTFPGCNDPLACNFNANAGCDDGSCTYPQYYIPVDFSTSNSEPMVLVCAGSEPANYMLADQACAQAQVDNDPFCINTDWDGTCVFVYNCCAGNAAGCTNTLACNFDPNACSDFTLCTFPGCNDAAACNFNANAGCDDGSCTYPQYYIPVDFSTSSSEPMVLACAGSEPANYILADQICAQERVNFDPFCINTDWDSLCASAYNCCIGNTFGCINQFACNFDPNACGDFTLCTFPGCNDPLACNYDATAGCDDGSCTYPQYYIPVDFSTSISEPMVLVCAGSEPANYILADQICAQERVDLDSYCIDTDWDSICASAYNCCVGNAAGCLSQSACNFDPNACGDFALCTFPGCTDPAACNYDANAGCDDGSCIAAGCIDPAACNFNAAAGCDDGSCVFGPSNDVCSGAIALSTNTTVTADNTNSCSNGPNPGCGFIDMQDVWYSYTSIGGGDVTFFTELNGTLTDSRVAVYDACGGAEIACNDDFFTLASRVTIPTVSGTTYYFQTGGYWNLTGSFDVTVFECGVGCTDPSACNYDPVATINSGTCEYGGCTYPAACNYDANASCDDGSCTYGGCTDPAADNYDANAGCDDSSCYFLGCTYLDADNYDATATMDDGTCTFTLGSNCAADLNNDGQVNSSDLLEFLGAFGTICP